MTIFWYAHSKTKQLTCCMKLSTKFRCYHLTLSGSIHAKKLSMSKQTLYLWRTPTTKFKKQKRKLRGQLKEIIVHAEKESKSNVKFTANIASLWQRAELLQISSQCLISNFHAYWLTKRLWSKSATWYSRSKMLNSWWWSAIKNN